MYTHTHTYIHMYIQVTYKRLSRKFDVPVNAAKQ